MHQIKTFKQIKRRRNRKKTLKRESINILTFNKMTSKKKKNSILIKFCFLRIKRNNNNNKTNFLRILNHLMMTIYKRMIWVNQRKLIMFKRRIRIWCRIKTKMNSHKSRTKMKRSKSNPSIPNKINNQMSKSTKNYLTPNLDNFINWLGTHILKIN